MVIVCVVLQFMGIPSRRSTKSRIISRAAKAFCCNRLFFCLRNCNCTAVWEEAIKEIVEVGRKINYLGFLFAVFSLHG